MKKLAVYTLLFLLSFQAFPFKKPQHISITKKSIEMLNRKFPNKSINLKYAKYILKGVRNEDLFRFDRLSRQHFYNPLKKEMFPTSPSVEKRFDQLGRRFIKASGKRKYKLLGKIIHHLQDATCPPHVVPVYHGPCKPDKFDELNVTDYFPGELDAIISQTCSRCYIDSLHKVIAIKTLDAVKQKFGAKITHKADTSTITIDWSYFWKNDPSQFQGHYGILGKPNHEKIDNYGVTKIEVQDTTYSIPQSIYDEFSKQQVSLAVNKTVEFIYNVLCLNQ